MFILIFPCKSFADSRLDNCLQYRDEIESILESENVSKDFFYLAVCESGCKNAESNKGAKGFFQMTDYTFKKFRDQECTDINDIKCSTIAAARYLKHLSNYPHSGISMIIQMYNQGGHNRIKNGSTKESRGLSHCVLKYLKQNNGD